MTIIESMCTPMPLPFQAGYGAYLAASVNLPLQSKAMMEVSMGFTGRKLLHV